MVPSFHASGRETGDMAVIDGRTYRSPELMPDIVLLDSRMLKKGDMSELAVSALSALAEAVESCTEDNANPINDSFAFSAIQLICENLPALFKKGYSGKYRLGLANGIAVSGIVTSNAPEGPGSALAEELAKVTGYSRELFSGLLLPYILDFKLKKSKNGVRGELLLPAAGIDVYCSVPENERSVRGVEEIVKIIQSTGKYMPASLNELKIPLYVLTRIAGELDRNFASLYGKGGVLKILESAYEGGLLSGGSR
jgi:alcohol dehydrogenase